MDDPDDEPLSHHERVERFQGAVAGLIDYWIDEYDLTLAEFVGVMYTEIFNRQMDAWRNAEGETRDDADDS